MKITEKRSKFLSATLIAVLAFGLAVSGCGSGALPKECPIPAGKNCTPNDKCGDNCVLIGNDDCIGCHE
jgi:hypothetical protein